MKSSKLIDEKSANHASANRVTQRKPNNTGLPNQLKSGIENLSGYSMDDVKVHYNSSKPAQLNAHAFAQGNQIHLASGQEKHLPHEAWHVVQQKQGRVKPTIQLKGSVPVNNDVRLEKEADVMGGKSNSLKSKIPLQKHNFPYYSNEFHTTFQLNKRKTNKQKARQKQETFKRRQNIKNELLSSKDPLLLYNEYKEKFKGDELAMANLNNAWRDFQEKHNSKSHKEHRADLMKSILKEFKLTRKEESYEDTDSSDGEDEAAFVRPAETKKYEADIFTRYPSNIGKLGDYKSQGEILTRLVEENPLYHQLAINLALHNYRTSLGGTRPQFRFTGHEESYQRPYEGIPGAKILGVLRRIKSRKKAEAGIPNAPKSGSKALSEVKYGLPNTYIPPSKFAVTLPVGIDELQERIDSSGDKELKKFIDSFSDIGSFGFSERSKTSWNAEEGEAAGTRLSLGEGISTEMYQQLEKLVNLTQDKIKLYRAFGSPNLGVLKAHATGETQLANRRKLHLAEMKSLVSNLKKLVGERHAKILEILSRHHKLFKDEEESEYGNFIIRESDLWEELIHISTLLTESDINLTLNKKHYRNLNASKTTEEINVNHETMRRHLFPSGTKAANELFAHLGGKSTNLKQTKGRLSTFTPYFEFYLAPEAILTEGAKPANKNMQVWINLSENAHNLFFNDGQPTKVSDGISKLSTSIKSHLKTLKRNKQPLNLVIDYTKFSSDLPKKEMYPLLTRLKNILVAGNLIASVYYIKSGLKYNTGTLERYQAGEVISYEKSQESKELQERAEGSFLENLKDGNFGSSLEGHYIDLMRKVDLLADHILALRRERLTKSVEFPESALMKKLRLANVQPARKIGGRRVVSRRR